MKLNGSGQVFCNLADKEKHGKVYQKKTFNPLNYMAKVTALFSGLFNTQGLKITEENMLPLQ